MLTFKSYALLNRIYISSNLRFLLVFVICVWAGNAAAFADDDYRTVILTRIWEAPEEFTPQTDKSLQIQYVDSTDDPNIEKIDVSGGNDGAVGSLLHTELPEGAKPYKLLMQNSRKRSDFRPITLGDFITQISITS